MIVVDASVVATMLLYADERGRKARSVLGRDTEWAAPEHWKAEVFSVIRGLALGNKIKDAQAALAVDRLPHLGVDHVGLDDLLPRMWQLRSSISGYDAAYVALAEARDLTLVTCDGRLARAATSYCRVELVSSSCNPRVYRTVCVPDTGLVRTTMRAKPGRRAYG